MNIQIYTLSYFNTLGIDRDFLSIGGNLYTSSPFSNNIIVGSYLDTAEVLIVYNFAKLGSL